MNKLIGDYILQDQYYLNQPRSYCKCIKKFNDNNNKTPQSYSVQIIKKPPVIAQFKQNFNLLNTIKSVNVLAHYDFSETANNYYLFTEFCNEGNLFDDLKVQIFMLENEARNYLRQILNGLKSLHEKGISNCDFNLTSIFKHNGMIKIGQIFLASSQVYKLETDADFQKFGACKELIPPEVLEGSQPSISSDLYAIGLLYYKLLFGTYPFQGQTRQAILSQMMNKKVEFDENRKISPQSKDFLQRTLVYDVKQRLKWTDVYRHDLLKLLNINQQQNIENSILVSTIDINKVICLADLNAQQFDVKLNESCYAEFENSKYKPENRQTTNLPQSQTDSTIHAFDGIKVQQMLDQVFFQEQISQNFKYQMEFYLKQRFLKSLTNIRLFQDGSIWVEQLDFLIVKGIYIISKKINQGMESLDPQAQEVKKQEILLRINQNELVETFTRLKKQINVEHQIISTQYDSSLNRMKNRLLSKSQDFQPEFLKTVNDSINFQFFEQLHDKIHKYANIIKKSQKVKDFQIISDLNILKMDYNMILLLQFLMNRNQTDTLFDKTSYIYVESLDDVQKQQLTKELEKVRKFLDNLMKELQ